MVMNKTAFFSHTILGIYQETSEHLVQFYSPKWLVMFYFQANSYDTAYPSLEDQIKKRNDVKLIIHTGILQNCIKSCHGESPGSDG